MKFILIITYILGLFVSCEKTKLPQEKNGILIRTSPIWETSLIDEGYLGSSINPLIIEDNKLFVPCVKNNSTYFCQLDISSGQVVSRKEYINDNDFMLFNTYQQENKLVIMDGWDNYCIDLKGLEYIWRSNVEEIMTYPYSWTSGINDFFFIFGIPRGMSDTVLPYRCGYIGNINTGELELFLVPDLGELPEPDKEKVPDLIVGIDWIEPFYKENKLHLLVYYGKQYESVRGKISQSYLGLFDYSAKKWIYEKIPLGRISWIEGKPIIEGTKVYNTLYSHVECRDILTGNIIWRTTDSVRHSPNGFCMSEDNVIVFEEGFNKQITAYSKSNGSKQWSTASHGSISIMSELNGVIYFSSGGDGRLHAIDASTGDYLWRLIAPDEDKDPGAFFTDMCYAIKGNNGMKGKIIACSYKNAVCYEAIR